MNMEPPKELQCNSPVIAFALKCRGMDAGSRRVLLSRRRHIEGRNPQLLIDRIGVQWMLALGLSQRMNGAHLPQPVRTTN